MKIIFTFLSVLFLLVLFNSAGNAQGTIAAWDFTGSSTPVTWASSVFDANLVSASGANNVTRGATAGASAGNNSFRTLGFQNNGISTSNTDYFQVTLTAATGYKLSLSTIDAKLTGTATFCASPGVTSQFAYSLDGTNFTLINSPQPVIGGPQSLAQINVSSISALQSVAPGTTVILRYYASGQTATGGWGFYSAASGTYGLAIGGTVTADSGSAHLTLGNSLTPFSQTSASPSAEQTYTIGGTNLANTVTITPPSGFEISKTTGSGFVDNTGNLTYTADQVLSNPTIYVRLHAAGSGSYSGSISHSSSDFATVYQAASGTNTSVCTLSLTVLIQARYNGSIMVPDTVTVELHDASSCALVDKDKELLSSSGTGTFTFHNASNGTNYYIAIKHRNSIETWSTSAQSFSSYSLSYNFTNSAAQAYGSNLVLKGGKFCVYSGDVNQDGLIDSGDLGLVDNDNTNYVSGYTNTDVNGDGLVDSGDLGITDNNNSAYVSKNIPATAPVFSMTGTLASFFQTSSSPSAEQTYSIGGTGLTANVTLVPPAGFEISKTTSTGFVTSSGSLVYSAADVMAGQTIYVRLNAGSTGSYSGSITHTSANSEFTVRTLAVSGSYVIFSGNANVNLIMGNPTFAATLSDSIHNYLLDKPQFCASYDRDRAIANWTSWELDSTWLVKNSTRNDPYRVDPTLPAGWPQVGSGYNFSTYGFTRGHLCPSADRVNTQENNDALFVMTNLIPQSGENNGGPWGSLEGYERTLVGQGNVLYILCGGWGTGGTSDIGTFNSIVSTSGVSATVPNKLWKVIIVIPHGTATSTDVARVDTTTRTIAVIMDNNTGPFSSWDTYRISVDSVEALTGYDFFSNVSPSIQAVIESKIDTGPTK